MPYRPPVTETLEHGAPDDGRPPPAGGLLARFVDWYADRPALRPAVSAIAVALVVLFAVEATVVVRHEPPVRPSPSPSPSPPPTAAQIAERRRVAYRTAQFAETQHCADRKNVEYDVVEHTPDWSMAVIEAKVAAGTPKAGQLIVEVSPFDIGVSFRILLASGTCHT